MNTCSIIGGLYKSAINMREYGNILIGKQNKNKIHSERMIFVTTIFKHVMFGIIEKV